MEIKIPNLSLVVLIGPSGSGKSTFAQKHFIKTEVLSSDHCRGLVSDNENDQAATNDAFEVLHYIASKRLAAGRLTVVDATNVQPEARKSLVKLLQTGFWDKFNTTWACLDCELMPWSAKAQELLRSQYAAVAAAGRVSVPHTVSLLERTAERIGENGEGRMVEVLERLKATNTNLDRFTTAYRQYCWSVESLDDLKLAPFHLLATENGVHVGENHQWHMAQLAEICQPDEQLLLVTDNKIIDVTNPDEVANGVQRWLELTERGGEGMVVKPLNFITKGKKGLNQPAVKCRGREYLRIVYGPDYDTETNLKRLRNRHLGRKRSLAIREFALGIEALERFVRKEPLRRVHECVFGVLALESEPVDPRL